MTTRLCNWLLLIAAALLTACAAPTPKVNLAADAIGPAHVITLIKPPEVKTFTIYAPHVGMAFGAIGGLVAGAHMASRADTVRQLVVAQKLNAADTLADALARELRASGYQVNIQAGRWLDTNGNLTLDVAKLDASWDRVLYVQPAIVGFWANGLSGNYQPALRVRAMLTAADRKTLLYDGHHVTGIDIKGDGWIIAPSVGEGFASYEALIARPPATAASLRQGIDLIARSVVRDMARARDAAGGRPAAAIAAAAAVTPTATPAQPLNGIWTGTLRCGAYMLRHKVDNPNPWTVPVSMRVEGPRATMERGDANYQETLAGAIAADQSLTLRGQGALYRSTTQPWKTTMAGAFAGGKFTGSGTLAGMDGTVFRECKLELARDAR
ncbi:hypothetical protein [uncultured Ramlibacter sp.]|uniref:hypothetical protein n=1 Tax=uncultured Ramlibacter sp. TaxID=260755 RepID=UPI00262A3F78|nr:hypothetical protein [uncultured Ramlibacter sp.]